MVPGQTPHQQEAAMSVLRFEPFRDPFERLFSMAATGTRAPLGMPMDVYRGEDGSYHVEADLPGADPDSVEVTVEHGVLTIRAERTPRYDASEQVIAAERPQGSFARQLSLGEGVDAENLTAGYADGVLHVTIPASPKAQARRVKVTRAAGGSHVVPGSTVGRARRPPAAPAAAPAESPCALPPKAVPAFSRLDQWPEPTLASHLAARSLSRKS
jgi:HSP20 family protein